MGPGVCYVKARRPGFRHLDSTRLHFSVIEEPIVSFFKQSSRRFDVQYIFLTFKNAKFEYSEFIEHTNTSGNVAFVNKHKTENVSVSRLVIFYKVNKSGYKSRNYILAHFKQLLTDDDKNYCN